MEHLSIFIVKFVKEPNQFPKIWKSHHDKLPTTQTIVNLNLRWDTNHMWKSWNNHNILGCIIPNVAYNIVYTPTPPQDLGEARHFVKTARRVIQAAHLSGGVTHVR